MTRYFGFFGAGDPNWGDRLGEQRPYSNLNWLIWDDPDLDQKLAQTRANGQFAIIDVMRMMFPTWPSSEPHLEGATFRIWSERIKQFDDVIVAFNLFDEPWLQNKKNVGMDQSAVTNNLDAQAYLLKYIWPGKLISMTAGGNELWRYNLPTLVDWIGMYAYSNNTNWFTLYAYFYALQWRKAKHQRIMAVPDCYDPWKPVPDQWRIMKYNEYWWRLISGYPEDVVAVCPFLHQTVTDKWHGADTMMHVQSQLTQWGYSIMERSFLS